MTGTDDPEPVKLYDGFTAALAVFFGSPIAGGVILRHNFKTLGNDRAAALALWLSLLFSAVLFTAAFLLPEDISESAFLTLNAAIMALYASYAKRFFGEEIDRRKIAGAGLYSRWRGAGIGLLFTAGIMGGIFCVALVYESTRFNTEADNEIRAAFIEMDRLDVSSKTLLFGITPGMEPEYYHTAVEEFNEIWDRIDRMADRVQQVALENGRTGAYEFMEVYRQLPPLWKKLALEISSEMTDNDVTARERGEVIIRQLVDAHGRIEKFIESVDPSCEDILYLLP